MNKTEERKKVYKEMSASKITAYLDVHIDKFDEDSKECIMLKEVRNRIWEPYTFAKHLHDLWKGIKNFLSKLF